MAPEVVTGEGLPNVRTDNYSMANVLFRLLFRNDPLAGASDAKIPALTSKNEIKMYGSDPVFIYDPNNDSNRPVRGVHNSVINIWPVFPEFIREAFTSVFTKGAKNPNLRKSANQWLKLFMQLKCELIQCQGCQRYEGFASVLRKGDTIVCPSCQHKNPLPLMIEPNGFSVMLFPGAKLMQSHTENTTGDYSCDDFLNETGMVLSNPNDPSRLGLRNLSMVPWSVKEPDWERPRELIPSKVVTIKESVEITFPNGVTVTAVKMA
jgi:hypothetical protein